MPETKQFESLGLKVNISVPSTAAEFDTLAAQPGSCLLNAILNIVYRSCLAEFRDLFIHGQKEEKNDKGEVTQPEVKGLEALTGVERKWKTEKDGEKSVEVWDETEGRYMKRVTAEKSLTEEFLQKHADYIAGYIVFDPKKSEPRSKGPKKLPEIYRNAAVTIFGNNNQEKWFTEFGLVFVAPSDETPEAAEVAKNKNIDLLGWKIKEVEDEERKKKVANRYV